MIGNENHDRREHKKQDGRGDAGLYNEGEARDQKHHRRAEWNRCEKRGREAEQNGVSHARHRIGESERCSLRQSDQHKAVDRCTNRNDGFLAEMLPGWAEETIGDDSALVRDRWTIPIREDKASAA